MNKTSNHIDYVEFPTGSVADLNKTKDFFGQVFDWSYKQWGDDYADTKDSGLDSGLSANNQTKAPLPVIYVSDIQATYNRVKAAGGQISKDIFSFPRGRRFHFKDPAGNELAAWSD